METAARKILTPTAMWSDFDDSLPLKESKVNEMTYDGIVYSEVYFSGRETPSGRVRIYGLYARPQVISPGKKIGGVLILPDCTQTVNLDIVNFYVQSGYAVLMVDYRGDYGESPEFTNYPTEIQYANYKKAGDVFKVERTAKETCWYEWAAVAKYAISFLSSRSEVGKIALVGIKQGGNVGWQALFNDKKVSCFVTFYGIGWQAYKGVFRHVSADIELDDERYRWLGGIDAHVYAQYVNCPVLYVAGTNSSDFDCDRGIDTLTRLNPNVKYCFNYAPRFRDTVNKKCSDDILLFLKKHLARDGLNTDKLYFPEQPQIEHAMGEDGLSYFAKVTLDEPDKVKNVTVYLSEGISAPGLRNWAPMRFLKSEGKQRIFIRQLGGDSEFIHMFAVAEYKNGVSVSSKISFVKLSSRLPVYSANMLYSSKTGADCFCVSDETRNTIGGIIFNENEGIKVVECAGGISGASSKYGLLTYKIGENRFKPERRSIIKFDIYCEEYTELSVSLLIGNELGEILPYTVKTQVNGVKAWNNLQINFSEFKNEQNLGVKDFDRVSAVKFEALGVFAINNVLLI